MPIPVLIVVGSWTVFLVTWLVSSFFVKRDTPTTSSWLLARVGVTIVILIVWRLAGLGPVSGRIGSLFRDSSAPAMSTLGYIGSLVCALGVALAIWARFHLGANWSSHPTLKVDHELVTTGPYTLVRHPIYTGIIAAMIGCALVAPSAVIGLAVVAILFVWRVRREERLLLRQFPNEYPAYKARTWALMPFVW